MMKLSVVFAVLGLAFGAAPVAAQPVGVTPDESIFKDTLVDMSWPQVKEAGEKHLIVLFPIAIIEEHGPHMDLSPDILETVLFCRQVKQVLAGRGIETVIAPPYYWGISVDTAVFPGTFSVKPETMKAVLRESIVSLKQWGFDRIVLMNLHGDRVHRNTVRELATEFGTAGDLKVYDVSALPGVGFPNRPLDKPGKYHPDYHAGSDETKTMWDYYPKRVNVAATKPLKPQNTFQPLGYAGDPARFMETGNGAHAMEALSRAAADRIVAGVAQTKAAPNARK